MKEGFTLIELLVVVLIIGILAAVAVPQYQKAVLKSRYSALMPITKAIAQGNEDYYLANGEYATQLPQLAIDKPEGNLSGVLVGLQSTKYFDYVLSTREGMNNNYIMYQKHSPNFADNIHCEAKTDDTQANDLCKALGGVQIGGSQTDGYTTYILQGNASDGTLPTTYINENGITLYAGDKCIGTKDGKCQNTYTEGSECVGKVTGACHKSLFDNSTCIGAAHASCAGSWIGKFINNSTCIATHSGGHQCMETSFWDSTCKTEKNISWSCMGDSFTNSECIGNGSNSCGSDMWGGSKRTNSTFDNSTCYGNAATTCANATFTKNSTCIKNYSSACDNNVYSTGAGCQAASGFTCPAGTPQPGGWDSTTETYTPTGWNGGYCDPSAMVGGVCPSGSPKQEGGTWE